MACTESDTHQFQFLYPTNGNPMGHIKDQGPVKTMFCLVFLGIGWSCNIYLSILYLNGHSGKFLGKFPHLTFYGNNIFLDPYGYSFWNCYWIITCSRHCSKSLSY